MENFVQAVRKSISNKNWYSALSLALTLPDICGVLEFPELINNSKKRYSDWFDKYLSEKYTIYIGPEHEKHIFLCGCDCYALRCALLHQGEDNISLQRARKALDSFAFIEPPPNGLIIHLNKFDSKLQLQVDIFCEDICSAVDGWINEMDISKPEIISNFQSLINIQTF